MKINVINTPVQNFTSVNVEERKRIDIRAGDTVKVKVKIKEENKGKEKIRLQIFEGLVLSRKHGSEAGATICVRKISKGIGIERIFPIFSPIIDKIEIVKRGGVKKSKLSYLRDKVAKEIRRQTRKAKLVNIATTSDIEETEKKIKEAEKIQKMDADKVAADLIIEKKTNGEKFSDTVDIKDEKLTSEDENKKVEDENIGQE